MRVLLVEDNTQTLASLAAVLRHEQYDLLTAPDGPMALEMAKLYPPDVVLLDIGLPGMDGYTVAQELRKQEPQRTFYIAAITGYGSAADKQRAAAAGIDVHVTKPADPAAIVRLLESFESKLQS